MDVLTPAGETKGMVELPGSVFAAKGRESLLWEAVRAYLANQRQGNASTKTRGEVSGTGRKPYRQKHTGRARHGSRRTPIFRGGGVNFGPKPRDYGFKVPKKRRQQALNLALTAKHGEGAVKVIEDFELKTHKTKDLVETIDGFGFEGSILLLVPEASENLKRASGNLGWLTVLPARQVHAYAVLSHDNVVFTETGLQRFLGKRAAEPAAAEAAG
ncbi:MAG: 50S ribosomal protein L4 [candidate division WOR-3 bacterium]|nr:MAG: 50S ribosomal protein L4 [candidate division WOR-3 bacterium]